MSTRAAPAACRSVSGGFLTVQYVLAVGLSFVLLVLVANLLVDLYARAAVRDALEEGTHAVVPIDARAGRVRRAGARACCTTCCAARSAATSTFAARPTPAWSPRRADVRLPSWLPGLTPDWQIHGSRDRDPRPMTAPRRRDTRGFVATELVLAIGLLLFPVVLLVGSLPQWSERQHAAIVAAREAAQVAGAGLAGRRSGRRGTRRARGDGDLRDRRRRDVRVVVVAAARSRRAA